MEGEKRVNGEDGRKEKFGKRRTKSGNGEREKEKGKEREDLGKGEGREGEGKKEEGKFGKIERRRERREE